jgi:predicted 2-oxoglutarate/Fe(II)-dependent dioxygenase YbiX|tara:strand:- start:1051 stop:1623 length:573 start_codon:yes stop_codon:yes gene_type:complete
MNHLDDYIMVQSLIPTQLCRSLIREISLPKSKWSKHAWYHYGTDKKRSRPEKELDVVNATEEQFKLLGKYLVIALQNYRKKYSTEKNPLDSAWAQSISLTRFNRYKVGTNMRSHYDHIQSLFDGKLKGIPILSFVGLLNNNYKGGAFMCREKEIKLRRGDILLFPSNFMYPHKVKKITKGIRYSFVCWAF